MPEGSAGGATNLVFTATLSATSTSNVTVDYTTSDGTALSASDYTATTASLTIPAGSTTGTITVIVSADTIFESNEIFTLTLSSPTNATLGTAAATGTILNDEIRLLPDTGQAVSYTATFGEDNDYSANSPSYTDNGDGTISDNVTGLMWQRQDDGVTYNWYEVSGTANTTRNPNSVINVCGSLNLAGFNDWRLPSHKELNGIVDYGRNNPAINPVFTGTKSNGYWGGDIITRDGGLGLGMEDIVGGVNFSEGKTINGEYFLQSSVSDPAKLYVRCVRGAEESSSFTDNGNGTVTDNVTGLMWQQQDDGVGRTWDANIAYCEGLTLGGATNWRLPNVKELASIRLHTGAFPWIDTTYFLNTSGSNYYDTSTTVLSDTTRPWHVNFYSTGVDFWCSKDQTCGGSRCVRNAP